MYFGTSVAINKPYARDDVTVLIGAPGVAAAFVFSLNVVNSSWRFQAKFTASDVTLASEDWFGGRGGLALHEDMAFVGSLTTEQVYVYRRSYVAGEFSWDPYSILRSSDFDYDVYGQGFSVKHMHRQGFGMAHGVETLFVVTYEFDLYNLKIAGRSLRSKSWYSRSWQGLKMVHPKSAAQFPQTSNSFTKGSA